MDITDGFPQIPKADSFQLDALSDNFVQPPRRKGRRRRKNRLIVDNVTEMSSDDLKQRQNDYGDTIRQWELAPPTKRLMTFRVSST